MNTNPVCKHWRTVEDNANCFTT